MAKEDWWCLKHNTKPDASTMLTKCLKNGRICSKLHTKADVNDSVICATN